MLRALIVDDEPLARARLLRLLEPREDVTVVGEADSVAAAADLIERLQPDLTFLDIEMSDGSGFEVFERTQVEGQVVFVTAYREHALRAFEVNALDYLLKPISVEQLGRSLARAEQQLGRLSQAGSTERLTTKHRVYLKEPHNLRSCLLADIVLLRATVGYVDVHLASGEVVVVRESLQSWEQRLPPSFVRTHRSTLVNVDYVEALTRVDDGWQIRLSTAPEPVEVSRRCLTALKSQLPAYRADVAET